MAAETFEKCTTSFLSDHVKALVWYLNVINERFQVGVNEWLAFAKQTYRVLTPVLVQGYNLLKNSLRMS